MWSIAQKRLISFVENMRTAILSVYSYTLSHALAGKIDMYIQQMYLFHLHKPKIRHGTGKWSFSGSLTVTSPESDCKKIIPSPMTAPMHSPQCRWVPSSNASLYKDNCQRYRPSPHSLTTTHYSHTLVDSLFKNYIATK